MENQTVEHNKEQNPEQLINNLKKQVLFMSQKVSDAALVEVSLQATLDDTLQENEQLKQELADLKSNIEKAK